MELIFVLVFLFLLLATITVAGHIIWVLIAMGLRWLFSSEEEAPPAHTTRIFEPANVPRPADDLAAFERQLVRFYKEGKISLEVFQQLLARVRAERAPKTTDRTDKTESPKPVVVEKVVVQSVSSVVVEPKVEPPP